MALFSQHNFLSIFFASLIGAASYLPYETFAIFLNIFPFGSYPSTLTYISNVWGTWGVFLCIGYLFLTMFVSKLRVKLDFFTTLAVNTLTGIFTILLACYKVKLDRVENGTDYYIVTNSNLIETCVKVTSFLRYLSLWSNFGFLFNYDGVLACWGGFGTAFYIIPAFIITYAISLTKYSIPFEHARAIYIIYGILTLCAVPGAIYFFYKVIPKTSWAHSSHQQSSQARVSQDPYYNQGYDHVPTEREAIKSPSIFTFFVLAVPYCFFFPSLCNGLYRKFSRNHSPYFSSPSMACYLGTYLGTSVGFLMYKVKTPKFFFSLIIAACSFVLWLCTWFTKSWKTANVLGMLGSVACSIICFWGFSRCWVGEPYRSTYTVTIMFFILLFFVFDWISSYIFT